MSIKIQHILKASVAEAAEKQGVTYIYKTSLGFIFVIYIQINDRMRV